MVGLFVDSVTPNQVHCFSHTRMSLNRESKSVELRPLDDPGPNPEVWSHMLYLNGRYVILDFFHPADTFGLLGYTNGCFFPLNIFRHQRQDCSTEH